MNDALNARIDQLKEDLVSALNEIDNALESGEDQRELAAGALVLEVAQRYAELLAEVPPAERDALERTVGRRVTDLRRSAAQLTQRAPGAKVERARDFNSLPFIEQRTPPKSIVPDRAAPSANRKLSVGAEVDSWCGKCKEMREHHVVAMVGDAAKQVICVVCHSRHGFRSEPPARTRGAESNALPQYIGGGARRVGPEDRELAKRQEAKRALQKELSEFAEPRPFDPKGRYKAGEIIVHPEHGRGKIENVLKSSLLVRFLEGLRPLNLS